MKRKIIILTVVIVLLAAACFLIQRIMHKTYTIDSKSRLEIENAVSQYLMGSEALAYDVAKDIEIKFDNSSNMYVATVSFENTKKKVHVFISKDIQVINSIDK